jgi:hypothetical protein
MVRVPRDPESFLTEYLPARVTAAKDLLGPVTSTGSVTARVPGAGEWSLRLVEGALQIVRGMEDDVMLQITVPAEDFDVLLVEPCERFEEHERSPLLRLGPLRALAAKPDVARLVRHVPGSVLFIARIGDVKHRLLVTPGRREGKLDSAECTIDCKLDDLLDAQEAGVPLMQLFVSGKLRITGNVQIAMALAGVLA